MKFGWLIGAVASLLVASQAQALSVVYTGAADSFNYTIISAPEFDGAVSVKVELFGNGVGGAEIYDHHVMEYDFWLYNEVGGYWWLMGGNEHDDYSLLAEITNPGTASATVMSGSYHEIDCLGCSAYRETYGTHTAAVGVYGDNLGEPVRYRVTFHGVVPEPTTWALMLIGFGMTGVLVRRRTQGDRRLA